MAAALPILAGAAAAPAVATPFTMGLMGAAANPLVASLAGGAALASTAAPIVATTAASAIPTNIFANAALPALSGTPAYTGMGMAGAPPTFAQSVMSAGRNIQGLMSENPALTSVAKQAAGGMMQPPPPPQVLQAPPIQSGQFAPVDFMSLLSQKSPQMQRRTSLLG